MNKGVIFKYTDRNGNVVKAVALHSDQKPEFSNYRKVFLRILNDDDTFKKTEEGKDIIAVKNGSDLIQIGFWD